MELPSPPEANHHLEFPGFSEVLVNFFQIFFPSAAPGAAPAPRNPIHWILAEFLELYFHVGFRWYLRDCFQAGNLQISFFLENETTHLFRNFKKFSFA